MNLYIRGLILLNNSKHQFHLSSINFLTQLKMKRIYSVLGVLIFLFSIQAHSQNNDSTAAFKLSGYVDAYYALYSDSVGNNNYQQFPDICPKSNVFGINVAQLTGQYTSKRARAVATFHFGDTPTSAWSPVFNIIQEANAGLRICDKLWLDAGLFKTHIGTEALLPKDNITSSLAVITYFEPWWQAGAKLSYTPNDKFLICLHVLNGYNTYVDNNKKKSFGLAFNYYFNEKGNIGYYNLIGDEFPDGTPSSHLRILNNVVFTYQLTPKFKAIIGADFITQQHSYIADTTKTANIYSGIISLKFQAKPKFAIYARGENFTDSQGMLTGVIVDSKNKLTGYVLNGATLGFEYKPMDNAFVRLEARDLIMDKDQLIFHNANSKTNTNSRLEAMINIGVTF